MCIDRGYAVVRVLSTDFSEEVLNLVPAACKSLEFAASIQVRAPASERKLILYCCDADD